jgi:hypothetical protein
VNLKYSSIARVNEAVNLQQPVIAGVVEALNAPINIHMHPNAPSDSEVLLGGDEFNPYLACGMFQFKERDFVNLIALMSYKDGQI